jgi:D-alanyl-D-alanine carboxypeptidase
MTSGRYARHRGVVAKHAKRHPVRRPARTLAGLVGTVAVVGCVAGGALAAGGPSEQPPAEGPVAQVQELPQPTGPEGIRELPAPRIDQSDAVDACASDAFGAARDAGDAAGMIEAFGGAEGFRLAASAGSPCLSLDDPAWPWVVVNKQRPLSPIDYAPPVVMPADARNLVDGGLREDAARALDALVAAAAEAGGEIALQSGYRSYATQVGTYNAQVGALGQEGADAVSARPGYSEHQLGLAADVVACGAGGCGTIYDIGGTPQGDWLAENAWRHGWIVRYEHGHTQTTGYSPEPWHLRYVGVELAQAYHEGDYHTLEEFFLLPAAGEYPD